MYLFKPRKPRIRPFTAIVFGAALGSLLLSAPNALAAPKVYQPDNTYGSSKKHSPSGTQKHKSKKENGGQRIRNSREDRRRGYGDWSGVRNEPEHRPERTDRRRDRTNRRSDRDHQHSGGNNTGRHDRRDRSNRRHRRSNRRHNGWNNYSNNYYRNNRRYTNYGYNNNNYNNGYYGNRRYRSSYRSALGINFIFGEPGYSYARWANSPYSFYRPGNWSYTRYRSSVQCQRILVEANHYDHIEVISVKECYSPNDGYYIIQGSERIVDCLMKD